MAMKVSSREVRTGVVVVTPVGAIDSDTDTMLEEHLEPLLSDDSGDLVFDMAGVDYLSSGGVRVILKTKKILMKNDRRMILVNMQPQIEKVFEIINALPSLKVFSSIRELDDYLDTIQRKVMETGD